MASQTCTYTIYTYRTVYRVKSSRRYIYMKGSDLGGTFTETLVQLASIVCPRFTPVKAMMSVYCYVHCAS